LVVLETVYGESPGQRSHGYQNPWSKQCWYAFFTSGVSSNLNLYLKQPLLLEVLKRLIDAVRWERGELWRGHSLILHHNNTAAHSSLRLLQFLAEKGIPAMGHPAWSLTWLQLTSGCFQNSRVYWKESVFSTFRTLNYLWKNIDRHSCWGVLKNCFEQCSNRWQHCKELEGDYFEKLVSKPICLTL
jgi:hypothetical protein